MKKITYFVLCMSPFFFVKAQKFSFSSDSSAKVIISSKVLQNAWSGGLNAPQFSTCDLNNDDTEDLVVFDRTAYKLATFLAKKNTDGTSFWQYAPNYESLFPAISNWLLMIDYDKDGKKDIFTSTPQGIKVYKNVSNTQLTWQLVEAPLFTIGFSGKINLAVSSTDIPAIVDIDNDGDIDILTFDSSGNFIEYNQNFSMENFGNANQFAFQKVGVCWGNFFKEHCIDLNFKIDCKTGVIGATKKSPNAQARIAHTGNALLVIDTNGDDKKDALFGHVTCTNIVKLNNEGTLNEAIFKQAEYSFPTIKPADFNIFIAPFYEDVTFDGIKDLLMSPCGYDNADYTVDYQNSAWLYKNTGTNNNLNLSFQQNNFLQSTMIDLGENTAPLLVDIDGDGDQDLLVGTGGVRGATGVRASIAFFENAGNPQKAVFEQKNLDFLGISQKYQLTNIKPFTVDWDANGVEDFGFVADSFKGLVAYILLNTGVGNGAFKMDINNAISVSLPGNVQNGEDIIFWDVNKDGIKDCLVVKNGGNIAYFNNKATNTNPSYSPVSTSWGGLSNVASLRIKDINGDSKPELLVANSSDGSIQLYTNLDQQPATFIPQTNLIYNTLTNKNENTTLGKKPILGVGTLNTNQLPYLIAGSNTGGLRLLKNNSTALVTTIQEEVDYLKVFPNPSYNQITFLSSYTAKVSLSSIDGKTLIERQNIPANQEKIFDLGNLQEGNYLLLIETEKGRITKKITKIK